MGSIDQEEVNKFIARNSVDERAAAALRVEAPSTQKAVLDRGDLFDCLNPSAALMGRISVAKTDPYSNTEAGSAEVDSGAISVDKLQEFVRENRIDDIAAKSLVEAGPAVQRSVLSRGSLTDCRNPSAVCLARIREAKTEAKGVSHTAGPRTQDEAGVREAIETFLGKNEVDFRAAAALRAESAATQRVVLDRGDLHDCQNPSAALMGRITAAREAIASEASKLGERGRSVGFSQEVEDFIIENKIDGTAAASLREVDPQIQKDVLDRGSLTDCRNPSAVCLSRLRDAKTLGAMHAQGQGAGAASTATAALYQQMLWQQQYQQQMMLAAAANPAMMQQMMMAYSACGYGYTPAIYQSMMLQQQASMMQGMQGCCMMPPCGAGVAPALDQVQAGTTASEPPADGALLQSQGCGVMSPPGDGMPLPQAGAMLASQGFVMPPPPQGSPPDALGTGTGDSDPAAARALATSGPEAGHGTSTSSCSGSCYSWGGGRSDEVAAAMVRSQAAAVVRSAPY